MNQWEKLVARLREQGYKGDAKSLKQVKHFVSEAGLNLQGKDGGEIDLDDLYEGAFSKKTVYIDADDEDVKMGRRKSVDEDDDDKKSKEDDEDEDDEGMKALARSFIAELKAQQVADAKSLNVKVGKDRLADDERLGYTEWKQGGYRQFLADVYHAETKRQVPERLGKAMNAVKSLNSNIQVKAPQGLNEAIDAEGGFLVPPEFSRTLLEKAHDNSQVVQRCQDLPMGAKSVEIPTVNETSRADGSRAGGVRGYWTAEAGSLTSSKPEFGKVVLNAHKLTVLVYITSEMIDDSVISIAPVVERLSSDELGFKLQDGFINGTGAGMPLGVLNANATVSVAKETNQAATTIKAENIDKMWARCWSRSMANAVWFINQDVMPQLDQLSQPVGTGGQVLYRPPGGLSEAPYGTLKGRPVIPIEQCATLGTVGDIILADMGEYLYGRRQDVRMAESIHVRFTNDETAFRFTMRADGQPWWNAPLTPFKGTNTQSPFITLATRS